MNQGGTFNGVQASEKVYQDLRLEVKNAGGHSSSPVKDNAIYHLAAGLARLQAYEFPVALNEVTRTYFERSAAVESDPRIAADMRALVPWKRIIWQNDRECDLKGHGNDRTSQSRFCRHGS